MSKDKARIPWKIESVDYFVLSVPPHRLATAEKIFSKELPYLVIWSAFFTAFTCDGFFYSYWFLQFSVTMRQLSSTTAVMYIPDEELDFFLKISYSPGVLEMRIILRHLIYLSIVFISWRGIILLVLMVLYADFLIRRFLGKWTPPISLRINIESVVLISPISLCEILAFSINSISPTFQHLGIWAATSQAWKFVSWLGGERGRRCVFLK